MKKLLLLLALLCTAAWGQTGIDIPLGQIGPYTTLASNVTWNTTGPTGLNNAYIFTPINPDQGMCLYLFNKDASTHTFIVQAFETADAAATTFTNAAGGWNTIGFTGGGQTYNVSAQAAANPTAGTRSIFFKASGAARVAISIRNGSGTGSASLVLAQTAQVCGLQAQVPVYCTNSLTVTVATATTVKLVSNDGLAGSVHVCGMTLSIGGATVTSGTDTLNYGTGATCGSGTNPATVIAYGTAGVSLSRDGAGNELFPLPNVTNTEGQSLCLTDSGSTAGTKVTVNYVIY